MPDTTTTLTQLDSNLDAASSLLGGIAQAITAVLTSNIVLKQDNDAKDARIAALEAQVVQLIAEQSAVADQAQAANDRSAALVAELDALRATIAGNGGTTTP